MNDRPDKPTRLVYSTEGGDQRKADKPAPKAATAAAGPVRVYLDNKRRKGKTMTAVVGIPGHPGRIDELGRRLKNTCGAGGTIEGRDILIQGDHRDRIVQLLEAEGLKVRRS